MWVRLDDSIAHHPKFVRAGPEAFGLFVAGLCYCNRYETDGLIPKLAVPHLLPGIAGRRAMELGQRLAANGPRPSWVDEGEHYRVHDYELYQLVRDDSRERLKRDQAAERKRRQRARERDAGVTVTRDGHAALPGPLPPSRPVLYRGEFSSAPARETDRDLRGEFGAWFAAYPRQEGEAPALQAWLDAPEHPPLGELLAVLAAQRAASSDPNYWRKAERYVRELGWRDQPLPPRAAGGAPRAGKGAGGGHGGAWEDR
jgi:hypothetical protein